MLIIDLIIFVICLTIFMDGGKVNKKIDDDLRHSLVFLLCQFLIVLLSRIKYITNLKELCISYEKSIRTNGSIPKLHRRINYLRNSFPRLYSDIKVKAREEIGIGEVGESIFSVDDERHSREEIKAAEKDGTHTRGEESQFADREIPAVKDESQLTEARTRDKSQTLEIDEICPEEEESRVVEKHEARSQSSDRDICTVNEKSQLTLKEAGTGEKSQSLEIDAHTEEEESQEPKEKEETCIRETTSQTTSQATEKVTCTGKEESQVAEKETSSGVEELQTAEKETLTEKEKPQETVIETRTGEEESQAAEVEAEEKESESAIVESLTKQSQAVAVETFPKQEKSQAAEVETRTGKEESQTAEKKTSSGEKESQAAEKETLTKKGKPQVNVVEIRTGEEESQAAEVEAEEKGSECAIVETLTKQSQAVAVETCPKQEESQAAVVETRTGKEESQAVEKETSSGERESQAAEKETRTEKEKPQVAVVETRTGEEEESQAAEEKESEYTIVETRTKQSQAVVVEICTKQEESQAAVVETRTRKKESQEKKTTDHGTHSGQYQNGRDSISNYVNIKSLQMLLHLALLLIVVFKKDFQETTVLLLVLNWLVLQFHIATLGFENYIRQNRLWIFSMELYNAGISSVVFLLSIYYDSVSKEYDAILTKLFFDSYHPSIPDKEVSIVLCAFSFLQIVLAVVKKLLNDDIDHDEDWIQQLVRLVKSFQ